MTDESYEVVTFYRGKDSATYLLSDFEKYGEDATPLWIRQYPGDSKPYQTIELKDTDGFTVTKIPTQPSSNGKWDLKALKRILNV